MLEQARVTWGCRFQGVARNTSDVDHSKENTVSARVNSYLFAGMNGSVSYDHSVRKAENYDGTVPWMHLGYDDNENKPFAFHEASRTRDDVRARLTLPDWDGVQAGVQARYLADHYPNSDFGLTNSHSILAGPGVCYMPTPKITNPGI